jgi:hypothetical protein
MRLIAAAILEANLCDECRAATPDGEPIISWELPDCPQCGNREEVEEFYDLYECDDCGESWFFKPPSPENPECPECVEDKTFEANLDLIRAEQDRENREAWDEEEQRQLERRRSADTQPKRSEESGKMSPNLVVVLWIALFIVLGIWFLGWPSPDDACDQNPRPLMYSAHCP